MLFNSFAFLVFFPVVTALYFAVPHRVRWLVLLVASCVFYMFFIPVYILILVLTIVVDYVAGILLEGAQGRRRRAYLGASIAANVGVLAVFKYWNFIADNVGPLGAWLHVGWGMPHLAIVLPIGLSFHTFQAMSYTIEVYRGHQKAERHFGIYALYVMFYPQLVAGPIERPQNLLHQFREEHSFDAERVKRGLQRMGFGMFKKVVLADQLAAPVNAVFGHLPRYHGLGLVVAVVFFSFQIYYDFSGYSDIALGSAEVMGFSLMKNFATPYFSTSIAEFWRRWHISLSTWFRDYVYIPLGGNKVGPGRRYLNLFVVFTVSGLWHGASWNFVIWGALHGMYLVVERVSQPWRRRVGLARGGLAGQMGTFGLAAFAWIFFRAATLPDAAYVVRHLATGIRGDLGRLLAQGVIEGLSIHEVAWLAAAVVAMSAVEWLDERRGLFTLAARLPSVPRYAFYYAVVYTSFHFALASSQQQFIYFQF
jgi:D-alanyl-lipoteichoic acid acyltransferase DltB (MBOAT superfamily)